MNHQGKREQAGYVLVWCSAALTAILGVLSFGLDWGVKSLVNYEVQCAADAAAIAGAQRMAELSPMLDEATRVAAIRDAAVSAGQSNGTTDGAFSILASDVEIGFWDAGARTFTAVPVGDANAVRVAIERSPTRHNPIHTRLAHLFGVSTLASRRVSTAMAEMPPAYALLGLESFTARGVLTVDGSPWTRSGNVASNGDVKLNLLGLIGVTLIDGHVATQTRVDYPLIPLLTIIRDGERRPPRPFTLPAVSTKFAEQKNDNARLGGLISGGGDLNVLLIADIPAGTYYVHDINVAVGALMRVNGAVTIYTDGNVNVLGTVLLLNGDPANLKIRAAGPGGFNVAANVLLSADVYAPQRDVVIGAGVIYRGRLVGRSIYILGTSLFYVRPDLPAPELGRSRVKIVC